MLVNNGGVLFKSCKRSWAGFVKYSHREAGGRGVKGEAGPSGQVEVSWESYHPRGGWTWDVSLTVPWRWRSADSHADRPRCPPPAQQEGPDPSSLGWNEATGRRGQSQLGLIKYNQNLKSWAAILGWPGQNRAHLCPARGINWCVKQTHLVPTTEMYLSIAKQPP